MAAMNNLIKIPELQKTLRDLSEEMYKSGVIEEMTDAAFSVMDPDDLEEKAGEQVDNVLEEILGEQFAGVGPASTRAPVLPKQKAQAAAAPADAEASGRVSLGAEEEALSARLK